MVKAKEEAKTQKVTKAKETIKPKEERSTRSSKA